MYVYIWMAIKSILTSMFSVCCYRSEDTRGRCNPSVGGRVTGFSRDPL